jgi:DNA-directed RNA polymerase subunit RPC12/RpoP
MINKEKTKGPTCSKCGSTFVYIRIKDKEIVCRRCGHIEKLKEGKNIK